MGPSEILCIVQCAFCVIVLSSAALSDWRTREVSDAHWAVIGIAGIVSTVYLALCDGMTIGIAVMIIGEVLILVDMLIGISDSLAVRAVFVIAVVAMFAIPAYLSGFDQRHMALLCVPISYAIFYILYATGIVVGGADTKCFVVMTMMFQVYPAFWIFPLIPLPSMRLQLIYLFPLMLLFHAALFSVVWPLSIALVKLGRGERMDPRTFFLCRMSIKDARAAFVWPKEDVRDGETVLTRGTPDEHSYDRLEDIGEKDVWVTPVIPFIVPILAAFVFMVLVGNLLFLPFI
jgi:preflagellin peptidase FlaK